MKNFTKTKDITDKKFNDDMRNTCAELKTKAQKKLSDVLSYVVSGLIPLKSKGFLGMIRYFNFSNNNNWLQGYFKFVRKTHNIKLDLRAHPCC